MTLIKDLPYTKELNSSAMASLQGGRMKIPTIQNQVPGYPSVPPVLAPQGPYGIDGFVLPEGAAD